MRRSQLGSAIILACVVTTMLVTVSTMSITLAKEAMENYQQLNFLAEPYLAALSKLTEDTGTSCGDTEIYELMAYAAAQGTSDFTFCGGTFDLNEIIDPYQTQFQSEFGASEYYLLIEDWNRTSFFVSPRGSRIGNVTVLTQMPIPLPDENVTRAMIVKTKGVE